MSVSRSNGEVLSHRIYLELARTFRFVGDETPIFGKFYVLKYSLGDIFQVSIARSALRGALQSMGSGSRSTGYETKVK